MSVKFWLYASDFSKLTLSFTGSIIIIGNNPVLALRLSHWQIKMA